MDKEPMRLTDIAQAIAQDSAKRYVEKHGGVLPLAIGMGLSLPGTFREMENRYHDTRKKLDQATLQKIWPGATKTGAVPPWQQDPTLLAALQARYGGGSGSGGSSSGGSSPGSRMPPTPPSPPSPSFGDMFAQMFSGYKPPGGFAPPSPDSSIFAGALNKLIDPIASAPGKAIAGYIERAMGPAKQFGEMQDIPHMLGTSAVQTFGKEMGSTGAKLLTDIASKAIASIGSMGNESARTAILQQLRREDPVLHDANDKDLMEAYHTMTRFAPTLSTDKNAVRSFLRQAAMSGTGLDFMTIKLLADSERAVTGKEEKK
jgi:hypothetical protein